MIKLNKSYKFVCDDCDFSSFFDSFSIARSKGWAIARDRKKCYCEVCAKFHRSVGSAGSYSRSSIEIMRDKYGF